MIPARWRMITQDDRSIVSFRCNGDGVDVCRAPASWVAERVDSEGSVGAIIEGRCPDHIPIRALQTLMPVPLVTREGIRQAMATPPFEDAPSDPDNETTDLNELSDPAFMSAKAIADTMKMAVAKEVETEPAIDEKPTDREENRKEE